MFDEKTIKYEDENIELKKACEDKSDIIVEFEE